ncbi:trans-sulfuration enzyme family protein [Peribacillus deserti]|uniref:Cystathionine gamma-synthase n=1 Tax=Peribacillus deserti TaxID=673318 RepID=A0A2N5M8L1_9BACI|nr:PLP-dependent aspartate aminotransferase family protein [Peribacillus deserti]PLT30677.1 cystathionine gamma-synthase [Peribacillus deserti]
MKIETLLVRAGLQKDPLTGSISTPIYQSATFSHPELGKSTGYDYSRTANPTRTALEEAIAKLEGGQRGFAFSSGMAAITSILFLFKPGDHLIVSDDLYGGTYRLLEEVFSHYGISASYIDTSSPEAISESIISSTKGIFIETPTNPLMKVTDLGAALAIAKRHGLISIVDNTFMTPYLQQPISFGADIVMHSATKYLGGHNDAVAGLVVTADQELSEKLAKIHNGAGAILGPQDSWLILRGMKTLAIRLERQQENTQKIAEWLADHPSIEKVYYPGLKDHPQFEISTRQASGYGAMLSFTVKDISLVPVILKNLKIISFAESLGGVESLITYPATQTHADIPLEVREARGITDKLLRLSVGIEDAEDLINDLQSVLEVSDQIEAVRS